jgi:bifunctional DNA-binding transcriptional regulator/antitoxin component of YhaV-PrlF toxin-antitoxin module
MGKKAPDPRPVGDINIHDKRGYSYIPQIVRKELGIEGKGRVPFFLDANVVLLVRKGATKVDILRGLEVLKLDLNLRWQEETKQP